MLESWGGYQAKLFLFIKGHGRLEKYRMLNIYIIRNKKKKNLASIHEGLANIK